jgi:phage terminase large subunit
MRALIVRKTHKSLTATGLVTFREQVAAEAIKAKILHWYGGSGEKPAQYTYENGSVIIVGGLDQIDKIMSSEYDVIFAQEATDLTPEDWEKLTTRLRNGVVSFQQLIADCNPQQPQHWLKLRCDDGKTKMLLGRHEDNPRLFDVVKNEVVNADGSVHIQEQHVMTEYGRSYLERLDNLSGVRKERLRYGRWAAAEGIIYGGWNPQVHISERKVLPREWPALWAIDFGFTNPFVWQMWRRDPDGRLWLEKEIYHTERIVEDHAKNILEVVTTARSREAITKRGDQWWEPQHRHELVWMFPKPEHLICDHDAEDRATLVRHLGITTLAAHKAVNPGIEAMQARLRLAEDGKPRLYVLRESLVERDASLREAGKPTCFAEEIEGYVWKPKPNTVTVERNIPDEPNKNNDHSMDTTRYVVAKEDITPRSRVRWM